MPPRSARGFTLIEALVVVAIMSIMLAIGMPSMSNWLLSRKAMSAAVFYQDGFALARNTAIAHNAHTRLVLTENATSGKLDWRVDLCFPVADGGVVRCDDNNSDWSTKDAWADNDPNKSAQSKSVVRMATGMPTDDTLIQDVSPSGATEVFFTPLGWVDTTISQQVKAIDLSPSASRTSAFKPIRVALTLSGIASICDPSVQQPDARGCPP